MEEEEASVPVMGDPMEDEYEAEDEFSMEAVSALDPELPQGERVAALKEAIKLCIDEQSGGDKPKKKPKKGGLAVIFGGKPE